MLAAACAVGVACTFAAPIGGESNKTPRTSFVEYCVNIYNLQLSAEK